MNVKRCEKESHVIGPSGNSINHLSAALPQFVLKASEPLQFGLSCRKTTILVVSPYLFSLSLVGNVLFKRPQRGNEPSSLKRPGCSHFTASKNVDTVKSKEPVPHFGVSDFLFEKHLKYFLGSCKHVGLFTPTALTALTLSRGAERFH